MSTEQSLNALVEAQEPLPFESLPKLERFSPATNSEPEKLQELVTATQLPSRSDQKSESGSHPQKPALEQLLTDQFAIAYQHLERVQPPPTKLDSGLPVEQSLPSAGKIVLPSAGTDLDELSILRDLPTADFGKFLPASTPMASAPMATNMSPPAPAPGGATVPSNRLPKRDLPFHDLDHDRSTRDNSSGLPSFTHIEPEPAIWWRTEVVEGILPENIAQCVDLNSLVYLAIKNSPRIQAISQTPLIRELQIVEADSAFDAVGFVRSNFNDRNDPVGNTLVTGGPPFLEDHIWSSDFGVKRRTRTGAAVELGQKLGFQNSNSRFFLPQDQGTATLALNVTQPLLRGRGRYINESQILIAQANSGVAWNTFSEELQEELQQVTQAYWRLYYDRSLYLQKKRNVERGQQILDILQARQELDSMPSQIARARAAVESRKTELANALRDIRNSETEIRRRIADRDWLNAQSIELVPNHGEMVEPMEIPLEQIVHTALEHRPEIQEAMQRAKASGVQNQIAENELLPELSLLLGSYVSALNGQTGILQSWGDQFSNKPGYNAGINFEMPYGNRGARSRLSQQKLQLIKIKAEVDESMQLVIAESQVAYRRVQSAIQTRHSALISIEASRADLLQQSSRWEQFGLVEGDFTVGQNPVILLNQVLDAQERLAAAELIFAQADLEMKVSEVALQRTMGTLLMYQKVNFSMSADRDNPYLHVDQLGAPATTGPLPVER